MFTAICNDPYSFHIQSHVTVPASLRADE
jgi:hypothetical protein